MHTVAPMPCWCSVPALEAAHAGRALVEDAMLASRRRLAALVVHRSMLRRHVPLLLVSSCRLSSLPFASRACRPLGTESVASGVSLPRAGGPKKKAQRASHSLVACTPVGDAHICLLSAPSARRAMARVGEARDSRRGAVWGCAVNIPFFQEGGEGCAMGVPARRVRCEPPLAIAKG